MSFEIIFKILTKLLIILEHSIIDHIDGIILMCERIGTFFVIKVIKEINKITQNGKIYKANEN